MVQLTVIVFIIKYHECHLLAGASQVTVISAPALIHLKRQVVQVFGPHCNIKEQYFLPKLIQIKLYSF